MPVFLFLWILNQNFFIITKSLTYHFRPNGIGQQIKISNRADLVASYGPDDSLEWRLNDEKLNFTTKIPRSFAYAKVTVNLNNKSQDVVTLSAQAPPNVVATPTLVDVQFLNTLPWKSISDGGWTLWQRQNDSEIQKKIQVRQYNSVTQFLDDPPHGERIGVVNVDPETFLTIPSYRPSTELITLAHSFRGSHTLSLYAQDEPLVVNFQKIDLNRASGADTLSYKLTSQGKVLAQDTVPDDGVVGKSRPAGIPQPVSIRVPHVGKGIYQLELKTSEDVLIRDISTTQHYLAFQGYVFLADGPSYLPNTAFQPVVLSMLSGNVTLQTPHTDGVQTISVGNKRVKLTSPKQSVTTQAANGTKFLIPRGDIFLTGKDITLEPAEQFFQFLPVSLPITGSPLLDGIDYIWAPYQPRETFGPLTVTKTFALADLFIKSKTLYFSINAPGLVQKRSQLVVNGIDVKLTRGPLPWGKLLKIIKKPFSSIWK